MQALTSCGVESKDTHTHTHSQFSPKLPRSHSWLWKNVVSDKPTHQLYVFQMLLNKCPPSGGLQAFKLLFLVIRETNTFPE